MSRLFRAVLFTSVFGFCVVPAYAANTLQPSVANDDFLGALTSGTFSYEGRYRYEEVHQDSLQRPAVANTLRTLVGYETGVYKDFQAKLVALDVVHLANDTFNDGMNGKTAYPSIGDPEDLQLNVASLTYTGLPQTSVMAGRFQFALDNQRWVGKSSWRQVTQSFDGVLIKNNELSNTELTYAYLFHQNRAPGTGVTNGTYNLNTHIMNAAYTGFKDIKLVGFSYLYDLQNIPTSSSATFGGRIEASHKIADDVTLTGEAEYARYSNYANNPNSFGLDYYVIEPGITLGKLKTRFVYEHLGSDGTSAIQTPMMSSHSMNGWADIFTTTPTNGLIDAYVDVSYGFKLPYEWLGETRLGAQWHDYNAAHTEAHYGNEIGIDFVQDIGKNFAVGIQYAQFMRNNITTSDTQKVIVTGQVKF